jgi:hypothetical protein
MFVLRALLVWLLIIAAETVHGIVRNLALMPLVGDFRARQISVFTGAAIIFSLTYFCIRWIRANSKEQLFLVGALWLGLTLLFEFGLGRFVLKLPWERLIEDYNLAQGGLLPIGLVLLFLSPFLAAKLRRLI